LLFVLCQDPICEIKARLWDSLPSSQHNIHWITPVTYILSSTFMGNSYFYTNILPDFLQDILSRPKAFPWVGTISGSIYASQHFASMTLDEIFQDPDSIKDVQVIALGDTLEDRGATIVNRSYWEEQEICCPELFHGLQRILLASGEKPNLVSAFIKSSNPIIQSLTHSSVLVRPALLPNYIQWLSNIWIYILTDPLIQDALWTSCKYTLNQVDGETVHEIPGYPLLEDWLVAYYFTSRSHNIHTMTEIPESKQGSHEDRANVSNPICLATPNRIAPIYTLSNSTINALRQQGSVYSSDLYTYP